MKKINALLLVSLFFIQYCFSAGICVNTSATSDLNADVSFLGPKIAFQDSHFNNYKTFSVKNNADFAHQIQKMTPESCSVVLGLVTSRECLIAGPVLKKNKLIGISPCCGHDKINQFYPYLYVGSAPLSIEVSTIIQHLKQENKEDNIYVIYKPTNVYSHEMFLQFQKQYTKKFTKIEISSDNTFDIKKFSYAKNTPATLVFFTYPLPSIKTLLTLSSQKLINKNTDVLGGSSWGDEITLFKSIRPILEKVRAVVCVEMLDWQKVKNSGFVKKFEKTHKRKPLDIEIISYDMTRFAVSCYKQATIDNKYDIKAFQHCMTHKKHKGVSGDFLFNKRSSFANRPIYITNLLERI